MSATQLLSATPKSLTQIIVALGNGGVPAAAADGTAFDPTKWALIPSQSASAIYAPMVVAAAPLDGTNEAVVLTADSELTPGLIYGATSEGVTGIPTNGVANVALFVSYPITSAPAARAFNLWDFIPRINKDEDEGDLEKFIGCLQEPLNLLWDLADRWVTILDSDLAPENFVDAILNDLGNPFLFADPLSLTDKRKLCRLLVQIYKLKGTLMGVQAAIQFFIGLRCEILSYDALGDILAENAHTTGFGELSNNTETADPAFVLGTGTARQFTMKLGTVLDALIGGSGSGTLATSKQTDRALKILRVMQPLNLQLRGGIRSGAEPTIRSAIRDNGAGSVDLIMASIANSAAHGFVEASLPGVNQINSATFRTASGTPPTVAGLVPGTTKYWNGIGHNTTTGTYGLLLNEITNALVKPVVTLTPGGLSIKLSWPAVTGATSYRIYKGVATFASPCVADNAQSPIEISGDLTSYVDPLPSGTTRYYMVTPVKAANAVGNPPNAFVSEGFFSDITHATAL